MPAQTPATSATAGYVDPIRGLYTGPVALTETVLANATRISDRSKLRTKLVYFSGAVSDGDTYAAPSGVKAVFTSENDPNGATHCNATITSGSTVTFDCTGNVTGIWLLMFIDSDDPAQGLPSR